jgi:hypothetical protein
MALVYGGVGRKKIKVLLAVDVPKVNTFSSFEYHRKGMVIVCSVHIF